MILPASTIAGIPYETATCTKIGKTSLIVYKTASGELKVCSSKCLHMNQALSPDVEDAGMMKCGMHNAKLDPKTMTYVSGPSFLKGMGVKVDAGTAQPQYTVTLRDDGSAALVAPPAPEGQGGCCEVC